jgi:hypothetical protein
MTRRSLPNRPHADATGVIPARLVQRKCGCGAARAAAGECEECRKKKLVQRRASNAADASHSSVPGIVHEVVGSPGRPLDAGTRAFFEPRFGHDFSGVRIHDDSRAAQSADSVSALAYTVGNHIAFGAGQYRPDTATGRELMAHELVHTLQQRNAGPGAPTGVDRPDSAHEHQADRIARSTLDGHGAGPVVASGAGGSLIQRVVVSHCTDGVRGAPTNHEQHLEAVEMMAQISATLAATIARSDATSIRLSRYLNGVASLPTGSSFAHFRNFFGLPTASGGTFGNRLTGDRFPTLEDAVESELESLANRLDRIASRLDGNMHYYCINGTATRLDCEGHCSGRDATSCAGKRVVLLCPGFWSDIRNNSHLLIHELAHQIWANVIHVRNFRHASCYASYVAGHLATGPTCTP